MNPKYHPETGTLMNRRPSMTNKVVRGLVILGQLADMGIQSGLNNGCPHNFTEREERAIYAAFMFIRFAQSWDEYKNPHRWREEDATAPCAAAHEYPRKRS